MSGEYCTTLPELAKEASKSPYGGIVGASREREKATAEKSSAVGDCAKLREALCDIVMLTMKVGYSIHGDVACGIIASKAKRALAAPPRNCDVGTAEEWQARHCAWCRKHGIDGDNKMSCIHPDMSCDLCALRWAQMPYEAEKEGAK